MPFCYVGKATKIFFFVLPLLALAGLVVGFTLLRHGGAHKARGGGPASPTVPDPIPADATAPASAARPEPLSPPAAVNAVSPVAAPPPPAVGPAVGSPPPLFSPVAGTNTAPPPAFLVPPAPVSEGLGPVAP